LIIGIGDWGLGIGDWGIGCWAKTPNPKTPKPQSTIPNPQSPYISAIKYKNIFMGYILIYLEFKLILKK
jgi:hypothetical protein